MITFSVVIATVLSINLPTPDVTPTQLPIDPKDWQVVNEKIDTTVQSGLDTYGKGPNREPVEKFDKADMECLKAQIWKGYAQVVLYTALTAKVKLPPEWINAYQSFYATMDALVNDKCGGGRGSRGQKLWSRWAAELRAETGDKNAMPAPQNLVKNALEGVKVRIISDVPMMVTAGRLGAMTDEFFKRNNPPKVPIYAPNVPMELLRTLPAETVMFYMIVSDPRFHPVP